LAQLIRSPCAVAYSGAMPDHGPHIAQGHGSSASAWPLPN